MRTNTSACDVIVIGAGPVGLLLAGLLGRHGLRVRVLERSLAPPAHSQAIGITPPSLEILSTLGLADDFVREGVPIRDCHVHGPTGRLGCASFRRIEGAYPFVLSLPQQKTQTLLEAFVGTCPTVELQRGVEASGIRQHDSGVTVVTNDGEMTARYAVGCDGCHSRVREWIGVRSRTRQYRRHFLMADFVDRSSFGDEAHLFFTALGAVESFPLPGQRRRWIVQTSERLHTPARGTLTRVVRERTRQELAPADQLNESAFSPWRLDCHRLHDRRVLLCGDAAHVMSPIGGQGMNIGFADAEFAAAMLHAILHRGQPAGPWMDAYNHCRRISGRTAAARAARGMWLGTWKGTPASLLRDFLLRSCLFRGPLSPHLGRWFAMRSLPFHRMEDSSWATAQLRS